MPLYRQILPKCSVVLEIVKAVHPQISWKPWPSPASSPRRLSPSQYPTNSPQTFLIPLPTSIGIAGCAYHAILLTTSFPTAPDTSDIEKIRTCTSEAVRHLFSSSIGSTNLLSRSNAREYIKDETATKERPKSDQKQVSYHVFSLL
jgi:hypothetical protein